MARTGTSHTDETREKIAEGQRATWARRHAEQVDLLRRMAEEAPTADARRYLEGEAEKVERRTRAKIRRGRSSGA
jgi:hypothetical protein